MMSVPVIVAVICFSIVILIGLVFAFLYLFRHRFMPYHAAAVEKTWPELDEKIRVLVIALMRVAGGGWLACSIALGIGLYVFILNGKETVALAITITGLAVSIPTLLATLIVKRRTRANPPVFAVILASILLVAGWMAAWIAG